MRGELPTSSAIPDMLKCPITEELFVDPVVGSDGNSYEREALVAKYGTAKPADIIISNFALKSIIEKLQTVCVTDSVVVPTVLCGPISTVPFDNPVIIQTSQQTYSLSSIQRWLNGNTTKPITRKTTDPLNRQELGNKPSYLQNKNVAAFVAWWKLRNPRAFTAESKEELSAKAPVPPRKVQSRVKYSFFASVCPDLADMAIRNSLPSASTDTPLDVLRRLQAFNNGIKNQRLHSALAENCLTYPKQLLEAEFKRGTQAIISDDKNESLHVQFTALLDRIFRSATSADLTAKITCSPELEAALMSNASLKQLFGSRFFSSTSQTHDTVKGVWERARDLPNSAQVVAMANSQPVTLTTRVSFS